MKSNDGMPAHEHLGWVNPVIPHDFPDPGVYFDPESRRWYAFSTNSGGKTIQCSYTYDFCQWIHHDQDVLPPPFPPWTGQPVSWHAAREGARAEEKQGRWRGRCA